MAEQTQPKSTQLSGLLGLLMRPVKIKNPTVGFVCCLALLAFAPIPAGGKPLLFLVAVGLGVGTVSALVFSPDLGRAGSNMASFFLAYLMHGLIALASVRGEYYPRFLAGNSFGQAIQHSALFVLLEWGAIMLLGRVFAASRRPTLPRWVLTVPALLLAAAVVVPWVQGRGNLVVSGAPPIRHWRFIEPRCSAEFPTALLDDVFIGLWWDLEGKTPTLLKGWDIKNGRRWTIDVSCPSQDVLPWGFLALGESGEVLVVHEPSGSAEAEDGACWVAKVDLGTATKDEAVLVGRAPWLGAEASAVLLRSGWQRPPINNDPSGAIIKTYEADGSLHIEGRRFRWELRGEPQHPALLIGEEVFVVREARAEDYLYHVFLIPPG